MFTSVVSTVPGTVAAYQLVESNPAVEIAVPFCGTLAASCICQALEIRVGVGIDVAAVTVKGVRTVATRNRV